MDKFDSIAYLKNGNPTQQLAYHTLSKHEIFTKLKNYDPMLVGTIPINIVIETSDLDIICHCSKPDVFAEQIRHAFEHFTDFKIKTTSKQGHKSVVARFRTDDFNIEIFGQDVPTKQQNAYRHMMVENKLLKEKGEKFRQQIIDLKKQGYKTEPAFGMALGLSGNAYEVLLKFE